MYNILYGTKKKRGDLDVNTKMLNKITICNAFVKYTFVYSWKNFDENLSSDKCKEEEEDE